MRVPLPALLLMLSCVALAACGGDSEDTSAVFTSDVVQRENCRVIGEDGREVCTRDVVVQRLRVTLTEDSFQRAWLSGIQRDGVADRTLLGSRDSLDGWLFEEQLVQTNTASSCVRTDAILLALRLEDGVTEAQMGTDDCLALIGRETRTTTTTPECDVINDPPQQLRRIVRRRWEPSPACGR